jgi:hypothetical protein
VRAGRHRGGCSSDLREIRSPERPTARPSANCRDAPGFRDHSRCRGLSRRDWRFEALKLGTATNADQRGVQDGDRYRETAQFYVPIDFQIGPPGQAAQTTRFLMNQTLIKTPAGWKVASILPIPGPPPATPK